MNERRSVVMRAVGKLKRSLVPTPPPQPAPLPPDFDGPTLSTIAAVRPYTMTSPERLHALISATEYIVREQIPGDIVECGVWRGGSIMAVALTLQRLGSCDRRLHLFDTFDGMPPPAELDRDFRGRSAEQLLASTDRATAGVWALAQLDEVKRNLASTAYPEELIEFVEGRVELTIPDRSPDQIALLRLDTDWYESTKHEMVHLFPRLVPGGVLIIDDYGHWEGSRRAVDEYLRDNQVRCLLCRIDYTGRIAVKQ